MARDYEALYRKTPNALGAPSDDVLAFFAIRSGLTILDVGCGQGRDALALGRAGHRVLGIDLSQSGIAAMLQVARAEKLDVTGEVADVTDHRDWGRFDVVLCDRTLHMLDDTARLATFRHLLTQVQPGGWCLVLDEPRHIPALMHIAKGWQVITKRKGHLCLRHPGLEHGI